MDSRKTVALPHRPSRRPAAVSDPTADLEALIREALPSAPRNMPAVLAANGYFQLLARPINSLDEQPPSSRV